MTQVEIWRFIRTIAIGVTVGAFYKMGGNWGLVAIMGLATIFYAVTKEIDQ